MDHAGALAVVAARRPGVAVAADPFPGPAAAVRGLNAVGPNQGAAVPRKGVPPAAAAPSAPTEEVSQPVSVCDFESA